VGQEPHGEHEEQDDPVYGQCPRLCVKRIAGCAILRAEATDNLTMNDSWPEGAFQGVVIEWGIQMVKENPKLVVEFAKAFLQVAGIGVLRGQVEQSQTNRVESLYPPLICLGRESVTATGPIASRRSNCIAGANRWSRASTANCKLPGSNGLC
jgi:hypothetical protein